MRIYRLIVSKMSTNCYIIASESNNAAVIDPGEDINAILNLIEKNNFTLKKILLTHGHFDHIGATKALKSKTNAKIYIHKDDVEMLLDSKKNLAEYIGAENIEDYKDIEADVILNDSDKFSLDEINFEVIHTPGHTKGSVVYKTGEYLFTGDTLFYGEVGRTDMYGGSYTDLMQSLKKLKALDGDYKVYPGHDIETTLDFERRNNYYLRNNSDDADI